MTFKAMLPWNLLERIELAEARADRIERRLDNIEGRLDEAGEDRAELARRIDGLEDGQRRLQGLIEEISSRHLAAVDHRLDGLEGDLSRTDGEVGRLRDGMLPAAGRRWEALFERLAFDLEETASLVERMLLAEPLPPVEAGPGEASLADGLAEVQSRLIESFRGSDAEIAHRLAPLLDLLSDRGPVLDLGCGRGELLGLLREAGIEARGIEADPALAQGALRRGLTVEQGDVAEVLGGMPEASVGAITAIHLFEHLPPARLIRVLALCRRVLVPGGALIAECPNPHSLRVGASLFWIDPTHARPLLPETLKMYLATGGFEVDGETFLHPFPDDQLFSSAAGSAGEADDRLARLERRLDDLVNGPRDFRLIAIAGDSVPAGGGNSKKD